MNPPPVNVTSCHTNKFFAIFSSLLGFAFAFVLSYPTVTTAQTQNPFTKSPLQFSAIVASSTTNEVYLIDARNYRIIAMDTSLGQIRTIAPIPVGHYIEDMYQPRTSGAAISPDGTTLAVACQSAFEVHTFSLPTLEWKAKATLHFKPTSVAFDSANRVHATGIPLSGNPVPAAAAINPENGQLLGSYGLNLSQERRLVKASNSGQLLMLSAQDYLGIYDTTQTVEPTLLYQVNISFPTVSSHVVDIDFDEATDRFFLVRNNGNLSVHRTSTGELLETLILPNGTKAAVTSSHQGNTLIGAATNIRTYDKSTGATLENVIVNTGTGSGQPGDIMPRGIAVTPNGRIVYISRNSPSSPTEDRPTIDGYQYSVGIVGHSCDLSEPTIESFLLSSLDVIDPTPANANGMAEPGETISITPTLKNNHLVARTNVSITLVSSNAKVVPAAPASTLVSSIGARTSVTTAAPLSAAISVNTSDAEPLGLSLQIAYDGGSQVIPLPLAAMKESSATATVDFAIGKMLAHPTREIGYVIDTTNHRILSINTGTGTVDAAVSLAGPVGAGAMALSPDGSRLLVALSDSHRIQILDSETLSSMEVIHTAALGASPLSVAMGSNLKIYMSSTVSGTLAEIDEATGVSSTFSPQSNIHGSQLRTNADHSQLYIDAVLHVAEYSIRQNNTPLLNQRYIVPMGSTAEIIPDTEGKRFYLPGIRIIEKDRMIAGELWRSGPDPFSKVAHRNGSPYVYGGTNRRICRFERSSGRILSEVKSFYSILNGGIIASGNERLLVASSWGAYPSNYYLNIFGHNSLNLTTPPAQPILDAGVDRAAKVSQALEVTPNIVFPDGSSPSTPVWSVVSGPSTPTFSQNGAVTRMTFSHIGRYQLKVRSNSGNLEATDTLWVEVNPENPSINISPIAAQLVRHPGAEGGFVLNRDGDINQPITVNLSASGTAMPGTDYAAISSTLVIPAGQSSVRLPITPRTGNGDSDIIITILAGKNYVAGSAASASIQLIPSQFQTWLAGHRLARPDLEFTHGGDDNNDGISNLMEYLLGRHPLHANPASVIQSVSPTGEIRFRALKNPNDSSLDVEFSTNMLDWHTQWNGVSATRITHREDHGDGTETLTVTTDGPASLEPKGFLRLKGILNN